MLSNGQNRWIKMIKMMYTIYSDHPVSSIQRHFYLVNQVECNQTIVGTWQSQ